MIADCECALGLRSPLNCWACSGSVAKQRPTLPHIYFWHGAWSVSREGAAKAVPARDPRRPTFPEACYLATLAAIYSGVWRA